MSRSNHGLDDKNSVGPNGYRIMSTGEAFLGENWPTEAVWRQVGGHCFEDHAKGSFETDKFEVNEGGGWPTAASGCSASRIGSKVS